MKISEKCMKQNIEIEITTDFIKLDQLLKFAGITETGGHAKEVIADGDVFLNGERCTVRGKKIREGDIVKIDDIILTIKKV